MAKTFEVEVTVPEGMVAGDTFVVGVEAPKAEPKQRGQLAGIAIGDMSDVQLKRELINAKSVHYKAVQRDASAELIAKHVARVNAALAEKASRAEVAASLVADATVEESSEVYSEEVSTEL